MAETVGQVAEFNDLVERFIGLANTMKQEGKPAAMINAALMSSSGIFATYVAAGNQGYLREGGVTKVTEAYRKTLLNFQRIKKSQVSGKKP